MDAETLRSRLLSGEPVDLRSGRPELDDLAAVDQWDPAREVPADLLVELVTTPVTGSTVRRRVRLTGARITGKLDLHSAALTRSLVLRQCVLTQQVVLEDADAFAVEFPGSGVPGLDAAGMRCRGSVDLSAGFTAEGEVRLLAAQIGGQLACHGGTFRNPGGVALNCDGLTVDQGMLCRDGFTAEGEVRLIGARIAGVLSCNGGTFRNPGGDALSCDGLTVDQAMFCRDGFTAEGVVRPRVHRRGRGAALRGEHRRRARLRRRYLPQPRWDRAHVRQPQRRPGHVLPRRVHRRGGGAALRCPHRRRARLQRRHVPQPRRESACYAASRDRKRGADGAGGLRRCLGPTYARVGIWQDDAQTWPDEIWLSGFTYTTIISNPPITVAHRLRWLRRDPAGYLPHPYEQLAASYRRKGDDARARQVLIAKQWHRRASHSSWWRRGLAIGWSILLWATIGYGYRPWRVLWCAAVLFLTGRWVFTRDYDQGDIVPKADNPAGLTFNAARYTADLLLPVANLGERAKFTAIGDAAWHAFAWTLAGWLLAIVLVAGLSGVFKRD
jgi:hypothetical protein